jgi:uncharacterized protein YbjQ (UPF0145 family)
MMSNKNGGMLLTTDTRDDGIRIVQYLGVVMGKTIIGPNVVPEIMPTLIDIVRGRSGAYEQSLIEATKIVMHEMVEDARSRGANGVIGIELDYETVDGQGSMLMVSVSGTAVMIEYP